MNYEFNGTKGPWQLLERGVIAACDGDDEWEPTEVGVTPGWADEDRQGAVAVPELIEACRELLDHAILWQGEPTEHSCPIHSARVNYARHVLAKATGEQDDDVE